MEVRQKDPERQRLGRLGALTVHARGRTNVGPARAAWLATIAAEVDPRGELPPEQLAKRMDYALRLRMTRLAMVRWGQKRAAGPTTKPTAQEVRDAFTIASPPRRS
jgi:hypothetical protein